MLHSDGAIREQGQDLYSPRRTWTSDSFEDFGVVKSECEIFWEPSVSFTAHSQGIFRSLIFLCVAALSLRIGQWAIPDILVAVISAQDA